ncbi:hypothetical protein QBB34_47450 [Streptomyces stelliscabiei]|uniref:hypothetical protein n=1 Tax=Streptomyces stelliscabiei TaxID=146820 RepID=UPI002FF3EED3
MGLDSDHRYRGAVKMDPRELGPAGLKRIPERDVSLSDIRYLAQIDVDRAALEERWGAPESVHDSLAEWDCFAFSPSDGEAFFLQREANQSPAPGMILSVTEGLFSKPAVGQIVAALGISGVQVTQVNAEATP